MFINEFQSGTLEWYAIQVKLRQEKVIATTLLAKGFEAFAPTAPRKKGIRGPERPLFPGYVFGRFEVRRRLPILLTPGVYSIVGYGKIPAAIPDSEILAIQKVVEEKLSTEPCAFPALGSRVKVVSGPLAGYEGVLLETRSSCRFVLSVAAIQRSIRIEVDPSTLTFIEEDSRNFRCG